MTYAQKYYRKNREKRKAASRAYRESHKKEYGVWHREYYKQHPFTIENRFRRLIAVLQKEKIRRSDVIWSFEFYKKLLKKNECHYCSGSLSPTGYNLDRKDNSLKHESKNVVPCCRMCNYTKNKHFSYAEMMLLSPVLKKIQKQRIKKD
jgi:hypothetical protein